MSDKPVPATRAEGERPQRIFIDDDRDGRLSKARERGYGNYYFTDDPFNVFNRVEFQRAGLFRNWLQQILEIADRDSAQEFGDAQERLQAISVYVANLLNTRNLNAEKK